MKYIIFFLYVNFLGVLSLVGGKAVAQVTEQRAISINTPHSSLVYEAKAGQPLRFVYYGEKISQGDVEELLKGKCPDAFPAYGKNDHGETALSVVHSDGSRVSDLVVETVSADAIVLKDTYYNLSVTLHFKTYSDNDIIETWTEVKNGEKGGHDSSTAGAGSISWRTASVNGRFCSTRGKACILVLMRNVCTP